MNIFKLEIFWLVIFLKIKFKSADYISTFTNGSLTLNTTISFSIFTKDFKGIIFYSVDHNSNRVQLKVKDDNNSSRAIRISYNDAYTDNLLKDICGCNQCNNRCVNISIILNKQKLYVSCNGHRQSLAISGRNRYNLVPIIELPGDNLTYIMVGNIKPYNDSRGKWIYPDKDQLIACLFYFKINHSMVHFNESNIKQIGTKVQPRCIKQCVTKDIFNKGQCIETYTRLVCVCNNTSLNGQRCNNGLKTYIKGVNTSYTIKKIEKQTYMQMKWCPSKGFSKEHCLLEFVNDGEYEVIIVNKTLSDYFGNLTINFVSVNITKDSIDYKIINQSNSLKFYLSEDSRINVGFSERSGVCETFNGEYDFIYELSMLRSYEFPFSSTSRNIDVTTNTSNFNTGRTSSNKENLTVPNAWKDKVIWIIGIILGITIVYVVMITAWIFRRRLSTRSKEAVSPALELIEFDEEDYSETVNIDYNVAKDNLAYSSEHYTYSTYKQSAPYFLDDVGPQLPPRDDEVSPALELIEFDEEDYSETGNIDYRVANVNLTYSSEQYTYSTYTQSAPYFMDDVGPQLPPRDDEKSEWIEIDADNDSSPSSSTSNTYGKVDDQWAYIRITDGEYAQMRRSVISADE